MKKNPESSKDIVAGIIEFLAIDCKNKDDPSENNSKMIQKEFDKS